MARDSKIDIQQRGQAGQMHRHRDRHRHRGQGQGSARRRRKGSRHVASPRQDKGSQSTVLRSVTADLLKEQAPTFCAGRSKSRRGSDHHVQPGVQHHQQVQRRAAQALLQGEGWG